MLGQETIASKHLDEVIKLSRDHHDRWPNGVNPTILSPQQHLARSTCTTCCLSLKDCAFGLITPTVARALTIHSGLLIRGSYWAWHFCSCPIVCGKAAWFMQFSAPVLVLLMATLFLAKLMPIQKENWVEWYQNDLSFYRKNHILSI